MMFAGTNLGKEKYLTVIMNQMVAKLYDRHEYTLYDNLHDKAESGETVDDAALTQGIREFRTEVFYDLLEAVEKQYEGITITVEDVYHNLGIKSLGLDYQEIIRSGIDIASAYIILVNALLDEEDFDGTYCPEGRETFYEGFLYNMEEFPKLEEAAINGSIELLKEDGVL